MFLLLPCCNAFLNALKLMLSEVAQPRFDIIALFCEPYQIFNWVCFIKATATTTKTYLLTRYLISNQYAPIER